MAVYYRYHDISGGIHLQECPVVKTTRCGVWVKEYDGHCAEKKFICNTWAKRYAYPTIEEAKQSFIRRKQRQVAILGSQLKYAKEAIRRAESGEWNSNEEFVLWADAPEFTL